MSRPLPVEELAEPAEEQEEQQERDKPRLTLVEHAQKEAPAERPPWGDYMGETDTLRLPRDSVGAAAFEPGSLLRLFRKEFRNYVHFLTSARGGGMSGEDACRSAAIEHDEAEAARLMEDLFLLGEGQELFPFPTAPHRRDGTAAALGSGSVPLIQARAL